MLPTSYPSPEATVSIEQLSGLSTSLEVGLSSMEANRRMQRFGPNEVQAKKNHPFIRFLKKFTTPSSWMLELIIVVSIFLHKYADLIVVSVLLVVNALISFYQEQRATNVVQTLRSRLHINVRLLRDGHWRVVPSRELVPGDIVRIRPGDFVPADLLLCEGEIEVDQSAMTGESIDVNRVIGDALLSGSVVHRGEAIGIVQATGIHTRLGKTTELVQEAKPRLHIEKIITKVVFWLFLIVISLMAIVIGFAFARETPMVDIVPIMLVLLMSAIPVSLPVMFTICLSVGASDLSKKGILITRLSAVEDAATMDQLCVDKTGTITMNQLKVVSVFPLPGWTTEDVLSYGALASQEANQDPIDLAFIEAARANAGSNQYSNDKLLSFSPFDAKNRRTEAKINRNGQELSALKGAVQSILKICQPATSLLTLIESKLSESAAKGYRVLAVAQGRQGLTPELIGLVSLYDPPRPEAAALITELQRLGIGVKMLTGDAIAVANELSRQIGLQRIESFSALKKLQGNLGQNLALNAGGYAEVYPEDKYAVVKALQQAGHVTGMTGDGVNDAPALRQAEVGIGTYNATDVARGAASVILTEPGLVNIVSLIGQGRMIYQRLLTWILNKISRTILKAPFVALTYVATGKFVISAFAMLLLVLVTDSTKIALATDNVHPSIKPETWKINGYVLIAALLGVAMLVESLLLLWFGWFHLGLAQNDEYLNTFCFLLMLYTAAFSILSIRERGPFWNTRPGKILIWSFFSEISAGTLLAFFGLPGLASLPWPQTVLIFVYAMVMCLLVNDSLKVQLMRRWYPAASARGVTTRV